MIVQLNGGLPLSAGGRAVDGMDDRDVAALAPQPRRADGYEFVDRNEEDPPIDWTALLVLQTGSEPAPTGTSDVVLAELAASLTVLDHLVSPDLPLANPAQDTVALAHLGWDGHVGYSEALSVQVEVLAPTQSAALEAIETAAREAIRRAFAHEGTAKSNGNVGWGIDSITAYPSGSDLASWNTSVHEWDVDDELA